MFEIYKTRPILAWSLTAVGVLFLAWIFWPRSSTSASGATGSVNYTGQSDAQLAASSQYAIAQLNAQDAHDQRAAEVSIASAQLAVQEHLAELGYQLDDRNAERNYNLQQLGVATSERVTYAQLAADIEGLSIQTAAAQAQQETAANLQAFLINANAAVQRTLIGSEVIRSGIEHHSDAGSITRILGALDTLGQVQVPIVNPHG